MEPDRRSKPSIQGLPPAAAAVVLTTIYPFFTASAIAPLVGGLPNAQEAGGIVICLLILMVSPISYPITPWLSLQKGRQRTTALLILGAVASVTAPEIVVFPLFASYTFWGIAESLSPVLREGILEGGDGKEDDDSSGSTESYRAKSTWE